MIVYFIIFIFVLIRRYKVFVEIFVGISKLFRNLILVLSDIFIWFYYFCFIKILIIEFNYVWIVDNGSILWCIINCM